MNLRVHHGYIGAGLMVWGTLATGFRVLIVGEYSPWLAFTGFLVGGALLAHDLHWHLGHPGDD